MCVDGRFKPAFPAGVGVDPAVRPAKLVFAFIEAVLTGSLKNDSDGTSSSPVPPLVRDVAPGLERADRSAQLHPDADAGSLAGHSEIDFARSGLHKDSLVE